MQEIFPIAAGVVAGLLALRVANARLRTLAFVVLSVLLGATATIISGEFAISWEFLLVDIPLVFLSGIAAVVLSTQAPRWLAQRR